ncbi:MAG: PEP/pyruvate-binding domain-containing protein [Rubrobacteraceae bacterium]
MNTTSNETIRWFAELDKSEISVAGGKGANQGELAHSELPVPPGFVVTTAGYRTFVEANDLQGQIIELAAKPEADDPTAYEAVSARIHDLFMAGSVPEDLSEEIRASYDKLLSESPGGEETAVAVRSSATAEDLPSASFAGQQETFLNVSGPEDLLEAVKECWASLWTARAMAYRERQGVEHEAVAMGVVVQAMVSSDVSGILFTANPNTGARDELIVNASFGLGEAIVSGEVTPDSYVLDRESRVLKETTLGTKEVMIVAAEARDTDGQRTTAQDVPEARRGESALSEEQLGELAALGVRVEEHFDGVPQDIEWAVAEGSVWVLQSRPITNLPPTPLRDVSWEPPVPDTVWMRRQVVEHMPEPLSPLFAELYLEEGLDRSMKEIATFMGDSADIGRLIKDFMPNSFAKTVNGYAYSIGGVDLHWQQIPLISRVYVTALPTLLKQGVPYWRDDKLPDYQATIERWNALDPASASEAELLRGMRELAVADAVYWFAAAIPLGIAKVTDDVLDRFLKFAATGHESSNGPHPASGPYLRGFPTKAMEAQAQLEDIAKGVRESEDLRDLVITTPAGGLLDVLAKHDGGQAVLDELQRYLDEYGHQIYNLDFVAPTMADDPLPVLLSLKAAVDNPERDTRARQEEMVRERESLVESTAKSLNPLLRPIFRLLLGWAQHFTPYREEALFYVGAAWPTLRRLALELGERLTGAGSLDDPDDVFFLNSWELASANAACSDSQSLPELAELARERRELREARRRLDPPISVPPNAQLKIGPVRLSMFEPLPPGVSEGPTLGGFAVSPGQVTAQASVVRSPAEFDQMEPDTILVCPTTTPAWTPLFSNAKGLVTDIGGALAHGSIVAREYGIPAVMGTGTATQRIQSGQLIQIDGDSGTVTLLDEMDDESGQPEQEEAVTTGVRKGVIIAVVTFAAVVAVAWLRKKRG